MAVGDLFRVTIQGTLHAQQIQTVLHWREAVSPGAGGQALIANTIDTRYAINVLPLLSAEYVYTQTVVQKFLPVPPAFPTIANTGAGTGGTPGSSLPTTVAAVVKKQTPFAGRFYRGRIFQTGLPLTSEVDSNITIVARTAMLIAWSAVLGQITGGGFVMDHVLFHRSTGTYSDVTSINMDLPLRVQRRREVGRGI